MITDAVKIDANLQKYTEANLGRILTRTSVGFLFFGCILAIQLGIHPALSGGSFGLLLLCMVVGLRIPIFDSLLLVILIATSLAGFKVMVGEPEIHLLPEIRAAGLAILLISFLKRGGLCVPFLPKALIWLSGLMFLVLFVQVIAKGKGINLLIPSNFFSISDDLAMVSHGLERATRYGYELAYRSPGIYSEPSYLGLVLASFSYLAVASINGHKVILIVALCMGAAIMSQSLYAVISISLVIMARYTRVSLQRLALLIGTLGLVWAVDEFFLDSRLFAVFGLSDESSAIRFVDPFEMILHVWSTVPFGVPATVRYEYFLIQGLLLPSLDAPFHNGILNIFISHGFLAIPFLVLIFRSCESRLEILYVLLAAMQNGGLFSFDKVFLISFVILAARGAVPVSLQLAGRPVSLFKS